jgi:dihydroxyacetone kinase
VLVFVNGMGATHPLELSVCFREVHRALGGLGIALTRPLVEEYLTSLDMAGVSLTLTRTDDELLRLWDAPCVSRRWCGERTAVRVTVISAPTSPRRCAK